MCGIVGIVSNQNVVSNILDGLKKLEYRGYDSAGIALTKDKKINVIRQEGKIENLFKAISKDKNFIGNIGIGHTRWATHGKPSEKNSHPHSSKDVSIVHNGIIENYQELKERLTQFGVKFSSETDSEVVPHLISFYLAKLEDYKKAVFAAIEDIRGTFALAIIFKGEEDLLVAAKKGSPLLVGYGENENYVASDYFALDNLTTKVRYLEDGDVAFVNKKQVTIYDNNKKEVSRQIKIMEKDINKISKDGYDHFMLKEIFEQPRVVEDSINSYLDLESKTIHLPNFPFDLHDIDKITIVACGTSYYAGMIGKYLIESLANITVDVDIASEFRYRTPPLYGKNLVIFISQSGETADSIAALKYVQSKGQKTLAIVNVAQSSMAHLADATIKTIAGPEIGVASTKAFTAQLVVLILLAIKIGLVKKNITQRKAEELFNSLAHIPAQINEILKKESLEEIKNTAKFLAKAKNILYIGRGISYVTSLEGALKLKELSYINAQGIAAGELKHGTIALIDKTLPVIAIVPGNDLFEKSASNVEEVVARGGKVVLISDAKGTKELKKLTHKSLLLPEIDDIVKESLLCVIPTQLLAYYVALYKGNDVDQPRNLAKSVTVE